MSETTPVAKTVKLTLDQTTALRMQFRTDWTFRVNDAIKSAQSLQMPAPLLTLSVISITTIFTTLDHVLASAEDRMREQNLADLDIKLGHEGLLILGDSIQANLLPANYTPKSDLEKKMVDLIETHRPALVEIFLAAGAEKLPVDAVENFGATQVPATPENNGGLLN